MTTAESEIEDVNYVARLFVQSYYNTLIEERNKMNKYFLPNSQFSFSQGVQESVPVIGRENIQKAFDSIAKSSIKVDLRSGSIDACGNKDEILILIHGVMYIDSVANSYSQTVFLRKDEELDSLIIAYDVIRVENVNELIAPPEEIAELKHDVSVPQSPLREQKPVEKAPSPPKSETVEKKTEEVKIQSVETTITITSTSANVVPNANDSTKPPPTTATAVANNNNNNRNNNNRRNNRNKYKRNNNNKDNKDNKSTQQQQQQPPPPAPPSSSSNPTTTSEPPLPSPPPQPSSSSTTTTTNNNQPTKQQQQQSKSKQKPKHFNNNNNNNTNNKEINNNNNKEKDNSKANSVVIKNLASSVKEEMLREVLIQFGEVKHIKIIPSITSHIAFVDFCDEKGKNAALEFVKTNKLTLESRDLTVEEHRNINNNNHGYYQKRRY